MRAGVGAKGRYRPGIIATPVSTFFRTRQRIPFLQIDNGLKFFHTLNGRPPKNYKEFEKEILKPAALVLPDLLPGKVYEWFPKEGKFGTLMVVEAK